MRSRSSTLLLWMVFAISGLVTASALVGFLEAASVRDRVVQANARDAAVPVVIAADGADRLSAASAASPMPPRPLGAYERSARGLGLAIQGMRTSKTSDDSLGIVEWSAQLSGPYSALKGFLSELLRDESLVLHTASFSRMSEGAADVVTMAVTWKTWSRPLESGAPSRLAN
jgi:hypothetical protein